MDEKKLPEGVRIDLEDDGYADDVVIPNASMVHLEMMGEKTCWMGVYTSEGSYRFSIFTNSSGKLHVQVEHDPEEKS